MYKGTASRAKKYTALLVMLLVVLLGSALPLRAEAYAPSQNFTWQAQFTATRSSHPALFAYSGGPCWGLSSCFIDTYTRRSEAAYPTGVLMTVTRGTLRWDMDGNGNRIPASYGSWLSWGTPNVNAASRYQQVCSGRANCSLSVRRHYTNSAGKLREEIFIFDIAYMNGMNGMNYYHTTNSKYWVYGEENNYTSALQTGTANAYYCDHIAGFGLINTRAPDPFVTGGLMQAPCGSGGSNRPRP